jgi:hypothetical protein
VLLLSVVLLLVVLHRRFRSVSGWVLRTVVLMSAALAGASYWQQQANARQQHAAHRTLEADCRFPEQTTKDPRSCYDPRDRAQFARHLQECKIVPGGPREIENAPPVDSRAVPCDYFDQFQNQPTPDPNHVT